MEEQRIEYNKLIHPDMKAIEKRDAFLSDENGKKLQEAIDQIHLMEEVNNWYCADGERNEDGKC